jgi:hypothetical protein
VPRSWRPRGTARSRRGPGSQRSPPSGRRRGAAHTVVRHRAARGAVHRPRCGTARSGDLGVCAHLRRRPTHDCAAHAPRSAVFHVERGPARCGCHAGRSCLCSGSGRDRRRKTDRALSGHRTCLALGRRPVVGPGRWRFTWNTCRGAARFPFRPAGSTHDRCPGEPAAPCAPHSPQGAKESCLRPGRPPSRRAGHPVRSGRRARSTATSPHRPDSPKTLLDGATARLGLRSRGSPRARSRGSPLPPCDLGQPHGPCPTRFSAVGTIERAGVRAASDPRVRVSSGTRSPARCGHALAESAAQPPATPLSAVLSHTVTAGTRNRSPTTGFTWNCTPPTRVRMRRSTGAGGGHPSHWRRAVHVATGPMGSSRRTASRAPSRRAAPVGILRALHRSRFTWNRTGTASATMPGTTAPQRPG